MSVATPDVIPGIDLTDMPSIGRSATCDIRYSSGPAGVSKRCTVKAVCRVRISCSNCGGSELHFLCQPHLEVIEARRAACARCMNGWVFIKERL